MTWDDFSASSVLCPRCHRRSPDLSDEQDAITWATEGHDCPAVSKQSGAAA